MSLTAPFRRSIETLLGNRDYTKFIILSRSRTGSFLLVDLLDRQREIVAQGEIFARLNGNTPEAVLRKVFRRRPGHIKAVGFKIFYYHPLDDDSGTIWNILRSIDGLVVLHLKRRNILRTLLSRKIASRKDVWVQKSASGTIPLEERRVTFTPGELEEGFRKTSNWEQEYAGYFGNNHLLDVYYEDLVSSTETVLADVSRVLHAPIDNIETSMRKQNTEALDALITNYGQLKEYFSGTEWARFFDE